MTAKFLDIYDVGMDAKFVETLYHRWQKDPFAVEESWARYFATLDTVVSGPSWQRANWPLTETDTLTAGLDPTQMSVASVPARQEAKQGGTAALDSIRAMALIRAWRVRGHLAANLDPLGLSRQPLPADLEPSWHGFTASEMDREVYLGGQMGLEHATVRNLITRLRQLHGGPVGLEYMHIAEVEERRFLQERFERHAHKNSASRELLSTLIRAVEYERFLGKKYVGTKRFGLDGGEAAIPAIEVILRHGSRQGVEEVVIGMNHRGRLNVLTNVMGKAHRAVFHEFAGGSANPEDVGGTGDVKYHLGTSTDRIIEGRNMHLSLASNPSHLDAVDPVVLGKARAKQTRLGDTERRRVLPLLIHGDAAFAGQGIIMECFGFSGLDGYNTGGSIHVIINNQVGFTTSPQFARSSPYPSDIAKMVQAPILHVNGDDPEAVAFAAALATDYRMTFRRDVVIDMWCYRRFGHNEGDEPGFTQPLMYAQIRKRQAVSEIYADRLKAQGVVDDAWITSATAVTRSELEAEFEAAKSYRPNKADWFEGDWSDLSSGRGDNAPVVSGVTHERIDTLGKALTQVPANLVIHPTLGRVLDAKPACSTRVKGSTGPQGKRWPSARYCKRVMASVFRGRIPAVGPSRSATRPGWTRTTVIGIFRSPRSRPASRCGTARSTNMESWASNMAMLRQHRTRW